MTEGAIVLGVLVVQAEGALITLVLLAWAEDVGFEEADVEVEPTLLPTIDARIPEIVVFAGEAATDTV
ncbi:hypothetical protein CPC08DRAFT_715181, partial [Agrocybe pediades]